MKFFVLLALFCFQQVSSWSQKFGSHSESPDSVLIRVYNKLNSLKNLRVDQIRELNYPSENYHNTSYWSVYVDFQSIHNVAGFNYQIDDSTTKQVYNGSEKFDLDKTNKTIQLNDSPDQKSFSSLSAFYNSFITLKNILPLIIRDKAVIKEVSDTTIDKRVYNLVSVNTAKRRIQNLGTGFDTMATKSNFIYQIIIAKDTYLPLAVLQKNDLNNDFIKTSFSNIETNPNPPSEISWYYSTYANEYKPAADRPVQQLLPNGSLSPEWKLEAYNQGRTISLNDLKGTVILIDFWIKNCGPCIESVAHLNTLQSKLKDMNFRIISINSYDSKEEVAWFYNKHKIEYTVLLKGKSIAEKYGVSGFPAFFVLDKTGKVIYSNTGFNASVQSQVEQAIKNELQ